MTGTHALLLQVMSPVLSESVASWLNIATPSAPLLLSLLSANALFSMLVATLIQSVLPRRLRRRPLRNVLALAGLGSLLPLAGPLLLLLAGLTFPLLEKARARAMPRALPRTDFASEVPAHFSHFGAGGALARLGSADTEESTRALFAIEHRRTALTTRLIAHTLDHPDETIRLLAFKMLERREKTLYKPLLKLENRLAMNPPNAKLIALEAARIHLEILELGFAEGSLREVHLEKAQHLLERIGEAPADAPWRPHWLLVRARWMTLAGLPQARIARGFREALDAGIAPSRALPWLLEQAWAARDYAGIRRLLRDYPPHPKLPGLGPVAVHWMREPTP